MKETVPGALAGERVDRVVSLLTGVTRAGAAALVASGAVSVGGRAVTSRSRRLAEGDQLDVELPPAGARPALVAEPDVVVPVMHADAGVIVVDKPPGLVVHPGSGHATGTMVQGLLARFPELADVGQPDRPGVVHRLDAGTSGLLVVARTGDAYEALVAQLKARAVDRRYLALVWRAFDAPAGVIDAPIGRAAADPTRMAVSAAGREARTRYEVRAAFTDPADAALVECKLETGRTHQIRVHLAAIGHPIVGDARYRGARASVPLPRPFLHAHRLSFEHPVTHETVTFTSPLPADLEEARGRFS